MTRLAGRDFREIWLVDFEFSAPPGENPEVVCLVAHELGSGRRERVWCNELHQTQCAPYATDGDSLFVAYYASAEIGCHLELGWALPENVLDLFTEFRNHTNGLPLPCGSSLLGALTWFGLSGIEASEKTSMRDLALRGGPWTEDERRALLEYCESDVSSLARLLEAMTPHLDLPRALLRGRYMKASARIERNGIPVDRQQLTSLQEHWPEIQHRLIGKVDANYGVYEGRTFKVARFSEWLSGNRIPWPRLESGGLDLSDDAFREASRAHPQIAALKELRGILSRMRLLELPVGSDNRNRCLLSAFRSKTGRNQPSNSRFIFGPAKWLRHVIRPEPGFGIAYVDWSQQEFGIAAALSGDPLMQAAYSSGDPYMEFAKQAGAAPPDASKYSHGNIREQFKQCILAVQYGMGPESLAGRIGQPVAAARELLRLHHETYRVFWQWSDASIDIAMLYGRLRTVFGWTIHVAPSPNPRSLRNFPMQANGAEMLRLACILLTESGIRVCAPVHDALLIEAPLKELDEAVATTQSALAEASMVVLGGFPLRSDAEIFRYPETYSDSRGASMWRLVHDVLAEVCKEQ